MFLLFFFVSVCIVSDIITGLSLFVLLVVDCRFFQVLSRRHGGSLSSLAGTASSDAKQEEPLPPQWPSASLPLFNFRLWHWSPRPLPLVGVIHAASYTVYNNCAAHSFRAIGPTRLSHFLRSLSDELYFVSQSAQVRILSPPGLFIICRA